TKEALATEVARAQRQGSHLAFAMLDIDHFKRVNDTYGHATGDRVLRRLARLLQQRLRRTDIIGRYGGEEFSVIMVDTRATAALQVLDVIRETFSHIQHPCGDARFIVTLSGGVAGFPECDSAATLNEAADRALYRAKQAGRNRLVLAQREE
ncbi:MAG: GGDEF domain-containing protein, partial [Armatimonadota bacterium]|nr:GGDEF domain-containing protein [Armatimonadota bacterium]